MGDEVVTFPMRTFRRCATVVTRSFSLAIVSALLLYLLVGCGGGVQQAQPRRTTPSITGGYEERGGALAVRPAEQSQALEADYYGHQALRLFNGLVTVTAVPEFGGRVMEYKLGDKDLLWANLAEVQASRTLAARPGGEREWRNWGGYKVWPAPQERWGGPPDPPGSSLDGGRWVGRVTKPRGEVVEVELTSPPDASVTGLQITRRLRLFVNSTRLQVTETFKNVSARQIEWSIWDVTQVPGALSPGEKFSEQARIYFPLNPESRFAGGYRTILDKPSSQWRVENGLLEVIYRRETGKIGADSVGGWIAYVDGQSSFTYAKRFDVTPGGNYPDGGCTVEVYTSGELPYMEVEVLSPLHRLAPGESASFTQSWYATRLSGPVRKVTDEAAFRDHLALKCEGDKVVVGGTLGVFAPGKLSVVVVDDADRPVGRAVEIQVSPATMVKLAQSVPLAAGAKAVRVSLEPMGGQAVQIGNFAVAGETTKAAQTAAKGRTR